MVNERCQGEVVAPLDRLEHRRAAVHVHDVGVCAFVQKELDDVLLRVVVMVHMSGSRQAPCRQVNVRFRLLSSKCSILYHHDSGRLVPIFTFQLRLSDLALQCTSRGALQHSF